MGALYPSRGARAVEDTLASGLYANWRKAFVSLTERFWNFKTRNTSPDAPSGRWLYITDVRYSNEGAGRFHLAPLRYEAPRASSFIPAPRVSRIKRGQTGWTSQTINIHGYSVP